jgi:hypothetical protein
MGATAVTIACMETMGQHESNEVSRSRRIRVLLMAWTAAVYPFSAYGDNRAIVPAFIALPVVVIWHAALIVKAQLGCRGAAAVVAVCHFAVFLGLWIGCLMLISKDSL